MAQAASEVEVYLEVGKKRTFAAALGWPGWCRRGRDEESALQALLDYGPRYARVLNRTQIEFQAPRDTSAFMIIERVAGNTTTDFGAPNVALARDTEPVEQDELERWQVVLQACWLAFDEAVREASGKTLSKGPRGGGRDLEQITAHVYDVDVSYLKSLGGKLKLPERAEEEPGVVPAQIRQAILTTLSAAVQGELPERGPRGGVRWTPRYFVRRLAWHELDHTWEIQDRAGLSV